MARAALRPRKEPRQARSRETVGYLLTAAAQVFGEHGYAGATTNEIAERAGVSIGSLYQYFPSKDAILVALARRHLDDAVAAAEGAAASVRELAPEPDALAELLVRGYVDLHLEPQGTDAAVHRVIHDEAPRTPEMLAVLDRLHSSLSGEVEHHLRRLGIGGPDPELSAWAVVRTVDALVHRFVLDPPAGRSHEQCVAEVIRVCRGHLRELARAGAEGTTA